METNDANSLTLFNFKLGKYSLSLSDLLSPYLLNKIQEKFKTEPSERFFSALVEVIRFIYLSSKTPGTLFFPGNRLMDEIWHALIVETLDYRNLCNKIQNGCFIDHSGLKYSDYSSARTPPELHEEQMSWVVSYINCFDQISSQAFEHLLLAQALCQRMGIDRDQLNRLGRGLISQIQQAQIQTNFSLKDFLETQVKVNANEIDKSSVLLTEKLKKLVHGQSLKTPLPEPLLSCDELESVFASSASLGFTLWQHLAAVERLSTFSNWRDLNCSEWESFSRGKTLIGLGTTHLAKTFSPALRSEHSTDGLSISGTLDWITGYGIFDSLLLGVETEGEISFALVPFPNVLDSTKPNSVSVEFYELDSFQGTNTVKLIFKNYRIPYSSIISSTPRKEMKKINSIYLFPEIGIVTAALNECKKVTEGSKNPRLILIKSHINSIQLRLEEIKNARHKSLPDEELKKILFLKDELLRDSVRLLTMATGGASILKDSLSSRLSKEIMLFDIVIQHPEVIAMKLSKVAHG